MSDDLSKEGSAPSIVVGQQILCARNSDIRHWREVRDYAHANDLKVKWVDATPAELTRSQQSHQERLEELFREKKD